MTIKEIQELVGFMDEKAGIRDCVSGVSLRSAGEEELCRRFTEVLREANAAGIDFTECMVDWQAR